MTRSVPALSCIAVLVSAPAWAGPLEPRLVAADATWVIHVDVESAFASSLGRMALADPEIAAGLAEARAKLGLDARDIKGITLWGAKSEGEDAVVVVHATAAVDDVVAKVRGEKGFEVGDADGYEVMSWTHEGKTAYGHVRRTRHGDDRIVFITHRRADLVRSLCVADGEEASAASPDAIIRDQPGPGVIVFVAVPELAAVAPDGMAALAPPILGKVVGMRFEAGERDATLFAQGTVTTATSEDAMTVCQAAQGGIALCKLLASGEPEGAELAKLADAVQVSATERTVTFRISGSAADVARAIEKARARKHGIRERREIREEPGTPAHEPVVAPPDTPRKHTGG